MENNGTEGAHRPIETTIYQQLLLSITVTDGSSDRTGVELLLSPRFFPIPPEIVSVSGTNDTAVPLLLYPP